MLLASLQGTGQEETIAFHVDMPKWLQNQSAMQKARVQWIFSADYISSSSDHGGDGGENTKVEEGEDAFQEKEITYGTISVGKRLRRQYLADDTPVSYTHLDVYKRQVQLFCQRLIIHGRAGCLCNPAFQNLQI